MQRGVWVLVALLALAPLASAFEVEAEPGSINAEVQAGGYVSELVELHADAPFEVLAKASPALAPSMRLTRHNATAIVIHFLPRMDSGEFETRGQLVLDVIGQNPLVSAGLQHATIPLNVTLVVRGKADMPAVVDLSKEQSIDIVPLSSDSMTLLIVAIVGIVILNIVLRRRR